MQESLEMEHSKKILDNLKRCFEENIIDKNIIPHLFEDIPPKIVSRFLGFSPQRINYYFHHHQKSSEMKEDEGKCLKMKAKKEKAVDGLKHLVNMHSTKPYYFGTKKGLYEKLLEIVPGTGRVIFESALKDLNVHRSKRPKHDLWSCESCDPVYLQELNDINLESDDLAYLLGKRVFVDALFYKHRVIIQRLVENGEVAEAIEYMKEPQHTNLKEETKKELENKRYEAKNHAVAITLQRYSYKQQLIHLKKGDLFVIIDFSTENTRKEGNAHICDFTYIYVGKQSNDLETYHIDFFYNQTYSSPSILQSAWDIFLTTRLFNSHPTRSTCGWAGEARTS